jgi:hypothetical protein
VTSGDVGVTGRIGAEGGPAVSLAARPGRAQGGLAFSQEQAGERGGGRGGDEDQQDRGASTARSMIDTIDEMWKATGGLEKARVDGRPS